MKKLRTFALALLALAMGSLKAGAQTVTATFGVTGADGEISLTSIDTKSGETSATDGTLTISFASASSGSNKVSYEKSSVDLKFQANTSFTLSGNVKITELVVNYASGSLRFPTSDTGFDEYSSSTTSGNIYQKYTSTSGVDASAGLTFTASANAYVTSIVVTYTVTSVTLSEYSGTAKYGETFNMPTVSSFTLNSVSTTVGDGTDYTVKYLLLDANGDLVTTVNEDGDATDTTTGTTLNSSTGAGTASKTTNEDATVSMVAAVYNTSGESDELIAQSSAYTLTITSKTPTLTIADVSKTVDDESFTITPTSVTDGLTISYSSSDEGVATISESTVTITGVGSTTITATSTATAEYASVTATFTLTVTSPYSFTFGEETYTAIIGNDFSTPTYTFTNNGSTVSDLSTNGYSIYYTMTGGTITTDDNAKTLTDGTTGTVINYETGELTIGSTAGTVYVTGKVYKTGGSVVLAEDWYTLTIREAQVWGYETIAAVTTEGSERNTRYLAYLTGEATFTPGSEITDVPGMTLTVGASGETWSVASATATTVGSQTCSYAASGSAVTVGTTDNIPTAGTFYKFTAAVNGVLTVYADCYNTNGVVESPSGVYVKKVGTATEDFDASTFDELANGFVVLQDSTYYVYCKNDNGDVLRLYGYDFEPSFILNGKAVPDKYELGTLKVGDADYEFPVFAAPATGITYAIDPDNSDDGVSISKYGELRLEKTTGFDGTVPYTITFNYATSTNGFGDVTVSLSYVIPDIENNANLYVLDESYTPTVGAQITSIDGITMTYGGWTSNSNKYTSINSSGTTSSLTDGWDKVNADVASKEGTFGGVVNSSFGDQNAKSETLGNSDNTYGSKLGNYVIGDKNSLPVRGTYVTFEPTKNGKLGIYILQNGTINTFNLDDGVTDTNDYSHWTGADDEFDGQLSWRPFYITDDNGNNVDVITAKVAAKLRWSLEDFEEMLKEQQETNSNATLYYDMSDARKTIIESLLTVANTGTEVIYHTDDGGWLSLMKTYAYYQLNVKSGKTYYIFSNVSKLGFAGFEFVADADPTEEEKKVFTVQNCSTAVSFDKNTDYTSVKFDRTFNADAWNTICLPFNANKTQVKEAFGENVQLLEYWGVNGKVIELVNHVNNQNIVAGVPYLIKPSQAVTTSTTISSSVYVPANIEPGSVSCAYNTGYTWIGSFDGGISLGANDWFISGGKFVHRGENATSTAPLYSYRCYLDLTGGNARALEGTNYVSAAAEDDVTDGIISVSLSDLNTSVIGNVSAGVYNLNGLKVADTLEGVSALPAGVYISGGKKVVIK